MNMDETYNLPESLRKSIELQNRLQESFKPILEQQARIQQLTVPLLNSLPTSNLAVSALNGLNHMTESPAVQLIRENSMLMQNATASLYKSIQPFRLDNSIWEQFHTNTAAVLDSYRAAVSGNLATSLCASMSMVNAQIAASPALQWIHSIDFSPWIDAFRNLHIGDNFLKRYRELNDICLTALYECKWFPYASWSADLRLTREIYEVLSTSRGASKRREKRIDKMILGYYTPQRIREIKRTWKDSDLEPHIKKILGQALEAHLRGEYALSIACLSTMWEGLIHHKLHITGRYSQKKTGRDFTELIKENDLKPVFGEFYEKLIVCDCNTVDEVVEGIPNRNGVSHSKYKKYPNKKASLNAILIADFIIHLEPKQETEEHSNGQTENAQP